MRASVVIEGAAELDRNLATLGPRVHKKVIRKGVREGLRPTLIVMRSNASSMVGGEMGSKIAKALQIRAPKRQRPGTYSLHVQLKSGIEEFIHITQSGKRHYIPAAIEYGHMAGDTYVPPNPFGRSAAESTQGETIRRFTAELRKGLLREAVQARYA